MKNEYQNEVTIIGGKFKGKKLTVNEAQGLRPTPARVRETVFSWLKDSLNNASVLDLFAGSGALGIEAYSRGAKKVELVDLNKDNIKSINECIKNFNDNNIRAINADAIEYLKKCNTHFDVVFIDPPYALNIYESVLTLLNERNLIDENSLLYVEMRNGTNQSVVGYEIIKSENAGNSKYTLWKKSSLLF